MRKRRFPLFLKIALSGPLLIVALYLVLCLAFFLFRYHMNHRKADPELAEPPRAITRMIKPSAGQTGSGVRAAYRNAVDAKTSAALAAYLEKFDLLSYRLTLDAGNPGSALMLQIKKKLEPLQKTLTKVFPDEDIDTSHYRITRHWDSANADVTADQARWLESQHDLLALIDQYCLTDGPTPLTFDECLHFEKTHSEISPYVYYLDFEGRRGFLIDDCAQLISAEGKWALQEGDTIRAQHCLRNLIKLRSVTGAVRLQHWIEDDVYSLPHPKELIDQLDKIKREGMTREEREKILVERYLHNRLMAIRLTERRFEPEQWGFDRHELYLFELGPIKIPGHLSFVMMYRTIRLPYQIKSVDKQWQEGLAIMQLPWPQVPLQTPDLRFDPTDDGQGVIGGGPGRKSTFRDELKYYLCHETQINLVRAALELLQDARVKIPDQAFKFKDDPHNPWRDPFTERPFHVIESTTGTLIYSLGPDMQDQHGKPINRLEEMTGYADEHYDIGIFVPKRSQNERNK